MRLILLISSSFFFLLSQTAFADNLDTATIAKIHDQVKTGFLEKCHKEMTGATDATCNCLADKAQTNLDDGALGKCANDNSGSACITQAVSAATTQTMSADSVKSCS